MIETLNQSVPIFRSHSLNSVSCDKLKMDRDIHPPFKQTVKEPIMTAFVVKMYHKQLARSRIMAVFI